MGFIPPLQAKHTKQKTAAPHCIVRGTAAYAVGRYAER